MPQHPTQTDVGSPTPLTRLAGAPAIWADLVAARASGWGADGDDIKRRAVTLLGAAAPGTERVTLKDDKRSLVQMIGLDGRQWAVKHYRANGLKTWLYHLVRCTPAWREYRGAAMLRRAGIRANAPVALLHVGGPLTSNQALALPYVAGHTLNALIIGNPSIDRATRRRIARAVGGQIGRLAAAGIVNRDHKPSNLIITAEFLNSASAEGDAQPVIIDPAGLRMRLSQRQVWHMLAVTFRAARRVGHVTPRECLVCLKAVLAADPSLARGSRRRLRAAAHAVQAIVDARPLSYDAQRRADDSTLEPVP